MKILHVLPSVPHPTMRGELRHYHFLRSLSCRHQITVLALAKSVVSQEAVDDYRRLTDQVHLVNAAAPANDAVASVVWRAWKQRYLYRGLAEMNTRFRRLARGHYDVVLCYGSDLYPLLADFTALPVVVDLGDATSLGLRHRLRYVSALEYPWRVMRYWRVRRSEAMLTERPFVSFISARDREAVQGPDGTAAIVPNGVDLAYWSRQSPLSVTPRIIFTGVMDYPPNADAARHLLRDIAPLIRAEVPDLQVVIAGRNPSPALLADAERTGALVTGFLDDLRPELESASVFVAPLRFASGMQNKILEAMAMQLPVVTTPIAADGLRVQGGGDPPVAIAEGGANFADAVIALLRDRVTRARMGMDGRTYVRRHFNWEHSVGLLERLCFAAAGPRAHSEGMPRVAAAGR